MLSTQLQTFAHSNGFTVKENLAFGVFEGFFVAISGKQSRKNAFISFYKEETDSIIAIIVGVKKGSFFRKTFARNAA